MNIKYSFPPHLHLSRECIDIIAKIFVGNPGNRITVDGIRQHPWFLKNLPDELRVRSAFTKTGTCYFVEIHLLAQILHQSGLTLVWQRGRDRGRFLLLPPIRR